MKPQHVVTRYTAVGKPAMTFLHCKILFNETFLAVKNHEYQARKFTTDNLDAKKAVNSYDLFASLPSSPPQQNNSQQL